MKDLASSNDLAENAINGRMGHKTWCKSECCAPIETSIEIVYWLEIPGYENQDFQVHCVCTFLDQIHIFCYDILGEKTSLVI